VVLHEGFAHLLTFLADLLHLKLLVLFDFTDLTFKLVDFLLFLLGMTRSLLLELEQLILTVCSCLFQ
jgi:hypothetical protein